MILPEQLHLVSNREVIKWESAEIFRIGTVRSAEGLWRMRRRGPVIAHCTDSEDFPNAKAVQKNV